MNITPFDEKRAKHFMRRYTAYRKGIVIWIASLIPLFLPALGGLILGPTTIWLLLTESVSSRGISDLLLMMLSFLASVIYFYFGYWCFFKASKYIKANGPQKLFDDAVNSGRHQSDITIPCMGLGGENIISFDKSKEEVWYFILKTLQVVVFSFDELRKYKTVRNNNSTSFRLMFETSSPAVPILEVRRPMKEFEAIRAGLDFMYR